MIVPDRSAEVVLRPEWARILNNAMAGPIGTLVMD
jgi:hypothetical protein